MTDLLCAGVELELTSDSRVGVRTRAVESGSEVATEAAVHARGADAAFGSRFAALAVGSLWTTGKIENGNNLKHRITIFGILGKFVILIFSHKI